MPLKTPQIGRHPNTLTLPTIEGCTAAAGRHARILLVLSLGISGIGGYLAATWTLQSFNSPVNSPRTLSSEPQTLLVPDPGNLDFGTIEPGGHREMTVSLENPGPDQVEIDSVKTSCECFEVGLDRMIVLAGQRVMAVVKVDFRGDPNFRGKLRLEAEGIAKEKQVFAFVILANVSVAKAG